jgi:tripeptide aminopeptidase
VTSDVLDLFLALAAIESPPGRERRVADEVLAYLRELGLDPHEDGAAAELGGDAGNIHVAVPATDGEGGTPILLCAHLDTVELTDAVEPIVTHGVVTNARDAILGADNKAAVAVMLTAVSELVREGRPHAGVELVLTPMEEVGLRGAKAFDTSRLAARLGFVYDHAAPIGDIVLAAPTQHTLQLRFRGRAAHAGIAPEEGRSAVVAAAAAITDMRLGRLDADTTANVGTVRGGTARNVVPEECVVEAEARGHDPAKARAAAQAILDAAVYGANLAECELESAVSTEYEAYRFGRGDAPVRLAAAALEDAGYTARYIESGGGADAHVFNARGIPCVNVCNGMAAIHTSDERIAVADLQGMLAVTRALIERARTAA